VLSALILSCATIHYTDKKQQVDEFIKSCHQLQGLSRQQEEFVNDYKKANSQYEAHWQIFYEGLSNKQVDAYKKCQEYRIM
jgi:hypothetical protein